MASTADDKFKIVWRYGWAVAAAALGTVLRLLLHEQFGDSVQYITYFLPIAFVCLFAGAGPGILATLLSALVVECWLFTPDGPFGVDTDPSKTATSFFIATGVIVSIMAHRLHTLQDRAKADLEILVKSRTQELEQRNAELAERTKRLCAVLNTAADSIITIDSCGIILSVNPATTRIFGYASEELVSRNIKILMPSPYHEEHDSYMQRYIKTGQAKVIGIGRELIARRKDGSVFPVDVAIGQVDHIGCFTGIIRDISDRKNLQKQVLEIAAEEQRRIGYELHDGVAQELTGMSLFARTLFNLIDDMAHRTAQEAGPDSKHKPDFDKACQIAGKLCTLLGETHKHVQDLSRGMMPVQLDAHGLRAALEKLAESINGHGVVCEFDCPRPISITDNTTATHLYRVAQEAVNNAVKHSRADHVRIAFRSMDGKLMLEVTDNGVGIDSSATHGHAKGAGSQIMGYRAALVGASLDVRAGGDTGTVVRCVLMNSQEAKA